MRYNDAKEMIKSEVPLRLRASLVPILKAGLEVYQELKIERPDLFVSKFTPNIQGWLKSYLIFRQFELDMTGKDYNYIYKAVKVNNFNYQALFLTNGNVNINLAKVARKDSLPEPRKYRFKAARNNDFESTQLKLDIDNSGKIIETYDYPYLAFLTYGGKNTLDFVELIVPTSDLKDVCHACDLLSEYNFINTNKDQEESRVRTTKLKLKEEVIRKLEIVNKGD